MMLTACASLKTGSAPESANEILILSSEASKADVWNASYTTLKTEYNVEYSDSRKGKIITETLKKQKPHAHIVGSKEAPSEISKITLYIIPIETKVGSGHKVKVIKNIFKYRDFFSEPVEVPSDGLEEAVILYRIQRQLKLKSLKPLNESSNEVF